MEVNQAISDPDSNSENGKSDEVKARKEKGQSNWSKLFRPWKWKKKKRSEKFTKTATSLERKISVRSSKDELIKKGLLPNPNGNIDPVQEEDENVRLEPIGAEKPVPRTSNSSDSTESGSTGYHDKRKDYRYNSKKNKNKNDVEPTKETRRTSHKTTATQNSDNPRVGRFQVVNSGGDNLVAVGLYGKSNKQPTVPVDTNGGKYHSDTAPKPMTRGSTIGNQQHNKRPSNSYTETSNGSEKGYSAQPRSNSAGGPVLSPGLAARLSQDLSKALAGNILGRRTSESDDATATNQQNQQHLPKSATMPPSMSSAPYHNNRPNQSSSISQSNSSNLPPNPSVITQRPVAARRSNAPNYPPFTKGDSTGSKGPPPKPPPKPPKETTDKYKRDSEQGQPPPPPPQYSKPNYQQEGPRLPVIAVAADDTKVLFADSADIIQRTTRITIPPYLREKIDQDKRLQVQHPYEEDSDSDMSGPILYRDDDDDQGGEEEDDDDDEDVSKGGLAARVARRDTLALRLANRPERTELEQRNIISSPEKCDEDKSSVKINLTRRLSQRPSKTELQQRNILPNDTVEDKTKEREKVKRQLTRKLSMRPTVKELIERKVLINWHEYVEVYEVQNYDRKGDKPWTRLTPQDKASIRKELNEFKATEMKVHEESRRFTRFHKP